jgi:LSD1 subclass zinc finger protein
MAQLICGGCRTLLMYTRSADTVRCSCCNTVNLVRPGVIDFPPALPSLSILHNYFQAFILSLHRRVNNKLLCLTIVIHNETE